MSEKDTTLVILGATGDLSQRKLIPALFNLNCKGRLPDNIKIIGSGRNQMSDDDFREMSRKGSSEIGGLNVGADAWNAFAKRLHYIDAQLNDLDAMRDFKRRLEEVEGDSDEVNRLYYLSIAPQLYEPTVTNLGACGLADENGGWRRVVIEKPFGYDLTTARHLNDTVAGVFREDQVFRIDHYLGKETVQNLLVFRFANAIFEPIWNRNYIDNVQITVAEQVDVSDRAAYYDQSSVMRDMIQNHLLQLLTLVAMEPPSTADAESLRNKKVEVLQSIRRYPVEEMIGHAVRGQYKGYLSENGVPSDSVTPTFGAMRLYVDNWRWRGVPFYLRTGKAMELKTSEIVIQFQQPPHSMFALSHNQQLPSNILGICVQPDEGMHLKFEVKVPDEDMSVQRQMDMEFHYDSAFGGGAIPEAYELLLEDALEGDASLFIRADHIEEAWRIVDPLIHVWEQHDPSPMPEYAPGSWGPKEADILLAQDGRTWQRACVDH